MKESEIQSQILTYLEYSGIEAWRNNVGRRGGIRFGVKGMPDIEGCLPDGRYLGIEVKTAEGKLSEDQARFHKRILRNKGVIFVARSLDDAMAALKALKLS